MHCSACNYPARMRKGCKVIGLYVCCRHKNRQISRCRHLCVLYTHNKSVDVCEKLVSVRFEWLAHKHYKSCLWFTDRAHSAPCAFCSCAQPQLRLSVTLRPARARGMYSLRVWLLIPIPQFVPMQLVEVLPSTLSLPSSLLSLWVGSQLASTTFELYKQN